MEGGASGQREARAGKGKRTVQRDAKRAKGDASGQGKANDQRRKVKLRKEGIVEG
jgi:hypothetical protein